MSKKYRVLNDTSIHTAYINYEGVEYFIDYNIEEMLNCRNEEYFIPAITSINPYPDNREDVKILHQLFREKLNEGNNNNY